MAPALFLAGVSACAAACAPQAQRASIGDAVFEVRQVQMATGSVLGAADFDADGHLDVVTADGERQLTLLRGDGRGGLVGSFTIDAGNQPHELATADLDGDGHMDIVVANHETNHLTLLMGDGHGALTPSEPLRVDVGPHVHVVLPVDVDSDGVVDLAVDHRDDGGIVILRGLGGGAFAPGRFVAVGGDPYRGIAAGDLNDDARPDFVTPNPSSVGLLLSTGGIPAGSFVASSIRTTAPPFGVALLDFDGDGDLDVVAASGEGSDAVEVFVGGGDGSFRPHAGSPIRGARGPKRIATGDLDGDGIGDAVIAAYPSPDLLVLFGGDANPIRRATVPTTGNPWGILVLDLNEDGRNDLVVADDTSPALTLFISTEESR